VACMHAVERKVRYEKPLIYDGHRDLWRDDKEWGRQYMAGLNPILLVAITALPAGSAITGEHVDGELWGLC
jgi:Lipoxygenase